jgi:hypothetical protein
MAGADVGYAHRNREKGAALMRLFPMCLPTTIGAVLLALIQLSCTKSVVGPTPRPVGNLILDGSFERDGEPTLQGWRITNPAVTTLVREAAPGGGEWSLALEADWAPTTGYVTMPIPGVRDGDVLQLSAFVRAVDAEGGGSIGLAVGPGYGLGTRSKWAYTTSTSWTRLGVQDTVSLAPGDTVWVVLSSFNTEIQQRQGHFDLVSLSRIPIGGLGE